MIRELKEKYSYKRTVITLSLLSFLFGALMTFAAELFLPFASSFYAALLLFEKPKERFLSYLIPVLTLAVSVAFNGAIGLINLEYVLLGLILVLVYVKQGSKAECALYMTIIAAVFVLLSLYFGAAKGVGSLSFAEVGRYYAEFYMKLKEEILDYAMTLSNQAGEGIVLSDPMLVENFFESLSNMLVSLIGIAAFAISGIAIKVFFKTVLRYSRCGVFKTFVHFMPSSLTAYLYLFSAVFYMLSNSTSLFSLAVFNAYEMLMVVFAYVGIRFLYVLSKLQQRKTMLFIAVAGLFLATALTAQILSFLGVWITINTNKNIKYLPEK